MTILEISFWTLAALVVYVYAGYPLLLWLLRAITSGRPLALAESEPAVTLIISAFNEEEVIEAKIRNSLALDYPRSQLEVLIVSDASDDDTDIIVRRYEKDGVRLLRLAVRGGKTLGLNEAVSAASGDIVIFSDANAMYRSDVVRALVRNFADAAVGAVVGESTYSNSANNAEMSESAYWRYEIAIKRLESALGSVVGGDGAIYAIRKPLYRPMVADALSDFVNPLQIVELGKRCVYEPDAVSVEEAAGSFEKEFRRKVRIVNRAWRAVMSMKRLMNPFRHGFFALKLISHKYLRWLVPFFLMGILATNIGLLGQHLIYQISFGVQALFYSLALLGRLMRQRKDLSQALYVPFYFCLVNIASMRGILEAYQGKTYTTWSTARVDNENNFPG